MVLIQRTKRNNAKAKGKTKVNKGSTILQNMGKGKQKSLFDHYSSPPSSSSGSSDSPIPFSFDFSPFSAGPISSSFFPSLRGEGIEVSISSTSLMILRGAEIRILSVFLRGTRARCGSSSSRYFIRRAAPGEYHCVGGWSGGPSTAADMAGSRTPIRPTKSPRGVYLGGLNQV